MKFVWVVSVDGTRCLFEHFESAFEDFKSHDFYRYRFIYPKFISLTKWNNLKDFSGW